MGIAVHCCLRQSFPGVSYQGPFLSLLCINGLITCEKGTTIIGSMAADEKLTTLLLLVYTISSRRCKSLFS